MDHSAFEKRTQQSSSSSSSCPVDHASLANPAQSTSSSRSTSASCPVDHASSSRSSSAAAAAAAAAPAQCPVQHTRETLDPRNHLPVGLTQERAPSQSTDLPTERTESSIPRDAEGNNWDYPSPQQFFNALVRKGMPTPEEEVETMVQIHNFLNERAWDEVRKWEARVNRCVSARPRVSFPFSRPARI